MRFLTIVRNDNAAPFKTSQPQELQDGNTISLQGFGTFEVKKKLERISVNPVTQQRMLIPPKLVLAYKPSVTLKEKFK